MTGKNNIAWGFIFLGGFMVMGFVLIYLRDFGPGREQWIADYGIGKHFETRLAHVHGALFSFLNVLIGYLLLKLPLGERAKKTISATALAGLLMPLGILAEVLFGMPPVFVLAGALLMAFSVFFFGVKILSIKSIQA